MALKKRSIWVTHGATLRKHIKKLQAEGYPHKQALAIALHAARGGGANSQFTQRLKARVKNFKVPHGLKKLIYCNKPKNEGRRAVSRDALMSISNGRKKQGDKTCLKDLATVRKSA